MIIVLTNPYWHGPSSVDTVATKDKIKLVVFWEIIRST